MGPGEGGVGLGGVGLGGVGLGGVGLGGVGLGGVGLGGVGPGEGGVGEGVGPDGAGASDPFDPPHAAASVEKPTERNAARTQRRRSASMAGSPGDACTSSFMVFR